MAPPCVHYWRRERTSRQGTLLSPPALAVVVFGAVALFALVGVIAAGAAVESYPASTALS